MRRAVDYLPRRASELVFDALRDTRVVVINGARQVGKSTLAEVVLRRTDNGIARFLDDPATREAALEDPVGFIRHDGLMLIDEVQRAPDLWLAIKNLVDRDPRPGRFLLTGSARLLALRSLPDALPGRSETIELWPLSQGEIDGTADAFVDGAFRHGAELRGDPATLRRKDYIARAERGGYPGAFGRDTPKRRQRYFDNYLADVVARDIKQVADIERSADMRRLISMLAARTSSTLNMASIASDLNITAPTVRIYLDILDAIFLVKLIPAWSSNVTTRSIAAPKVMFVDSGLAAHAGMSTAIDANVGGLIENFVVGELARQLTWSDSGARLYHYRDRDQREIDAVLEDNAGQVIGIEVKAAETARTADFATLRILRDRLGDRFRAGFVLYCGDESLRFGDKLACLPISALWTAAP